MRVSVISSLLLSALAAAEVQKPLQEKPAGWFDKAKDFLSSASSSPIKAASAKAASTIVEEITNENWREKILFGDSSAPVQEWMVFFTGNASCFGRCDAADQAFNASSVTLSTKKPAPKLGRVDCDIEKLLCATWSGGVPEIWHFLISKINDDQTRAPSPLHIVPLFPKNVTADHIVKIHTQKTYLDFPEYTGPYHPIDGLLQQYYLLEPLGWLLRAFGATPSWLFMIIISFFSRSVMSKRSAAQARAPAAGAPKAAQAGKAGK